MRAATLAAVLVAVVATAAVEPTTRAARPASLTLSDVRFAQQDWFRADRRRVARNTLWGVFRYRYRRVARATRFLNLVVTANGRRSWAIGNMPIFPHPSGSPGRRTIPGTTFFNLARLGIRTGRPLRSLCFVARLSFSRSSSAPTGPRRCRRVASESYVAGDDPRMAPPGDFRSGVGAPATIRYGAREPLPRLLSAGAAAGNGARAAQEAPGPRLYNRVQEGTEMCMPGGFARSLDWLNREYGFGAKLTAQEIYAGLVEAGAGKKMGNDVPFEGRDLRARQLRGERLTAKMNFANRVFGQNRIVTKVWDLESSAPNEGVVHTTLPKRAPRGPNPEDLDAWLQREWQAGEDVELGWIAEGQAHFLTLTEVAVKANGRRRRQPEPASFKVKYREDGQQGTGANLKEGDAGPVDGTLFKGPVLVDGVRTPMWRFGDRHGNSNHVVQFAVSESPNPANPPGNDPPPGNQPNPPQIAPPPEQQPPPENPLFAFAPW